MRNKPPRGRIPLREQMLANRAVMLAMCPTQEARDRLMADLPAIADKKVRAPRKVSGDQKELGKGGIQDDIMKFLRKHPKVAIVNRYQSGQAKFGNKRVNFNSAKGQSDIMGTLKGGRTFAFEVKRPKGENSAAGVVHDHQEKFLAKIRAAGGIGEVVRSVDDVIRILEAA